MRFGKLPIGKKFVHEIGRLYIFEKKSLSSAYVLDPETLKPIHLTASFRRCDKKGSFVEFSKAVNVHPLEDEPAKC